jgi:hypothetical protein
MYLCFHWQCHLKTRLKEILAIDPMVWSTPASISSDDLQHLKGAANIQTLP